MELGGVNLGLRELVMFLVALVVIYMVVQLVLMHRSRPLPLPSAPPVVAEPGFGPALAAAYQAPEEETTSTSWDATNSQFAQNAFMDGVERELDQLRSEVDVLRTEVAVLREELQGQLNLSRATQAIAPIYGDAMKMALAGHDAGLISERCGIARAEAELVEAMIRNQKARSG